MSDKTLPEDNPYFHTLFGKDQDCTAEIEQTEQDEGTDADAYGEENNSFLGVVEERRPRGGIFENVLGMDHTWKSGRFTDETPLELLIKRLEAIKDDSGNRFYTGIEVLRLDAQHWLDISRGRTDLQSCRDPVSDAQGTTCQVTFQVRDFRF